MLKGRELFISGGGVAGCALALALARRGAAVTLAEQAAGLSGSGAMDGARSGPAHRPAPPRPETPAAAGGWRGGGLQISPNGTRVLQALGLGEALRGHSLEAAAVELLDGFTGQRVIRIPFARHLGATGYRLFRRSDLVAMLAQAAAQAGVRLERPARVEWLGETGQGVRLRLAGQEREVALAVAADGIHSGARALLNGPGKAFFTGQVAWRAIIEDSAPATPPEARVFLGPGMHLVTTPLAGGARNLVAVMERAAWAGEDWDQAADPETLRHEFSSFAPQVRGWLAQVREVRLWGLFRHPVAARWHGARLALLGDAAHPTLPFMAQGANMALEDAWLLAAALDALPVELALPRWQALRAPRVRRAIEAANANARAYHLRGLTRYAAHRALWLGSMLAPGAALARFRWLYDHDVTAQRI